LETLKTFFGCACDIARRIKGNEALEKMTGAINREMRCKAATESLIGHVSTLVIWQIGP
jgi:hypothetical protein